jgi:hypothetical protein
MSERADLIWLDRADIVIVVYALGAMHAHIFKSPTPAGIAMVMSSLSLCKKVGLNIDAKEIFAEQAKINRVS